MSVCMCVCVFGSVFTEKNQRIVYLKRNNQKMPNEKCENYVALRFVCARYAFCFVFLALYILFLAHRIWTCYLTRFAHIFLLLLARRRFFAFQQNAVKVAMKDRCACERARVSVSVIVCLICLMYCLWSSIGVYVCNLDRWVGVCVSVFLLLYFRFVSFLHFSHVSVRKYIAHGHLLLPSLLLFFHQIGLSENSSVLFSFFLSFFLTLTIYILFIYSFIFSICIFCP